MSENKVAIKESAIESDSKDDGNESKKDAKGHLSIVIVGHVDAGKSTTTGRLLYELGGISDRELDKVKSIAKANNKQSFEFAYIMDKGRASREQGITIDCATKQFFTKNYHYSIIDAPGHKDFIKNMISGAAQADCALLMVPANKGGFETSITKSKAIRANGGSVRVIGQTRQHARLCHLLGIEQMIVCVNKMDDPSVNYSESRFDEIKQEVTKMLNKIGFKSKRIAFIPISGYKGDNLVSQSQNMAWYQGWEVTSKKEKANNKKGEKSKVHGMTLLDALDNAIRLPKRAVDKPLCMPVSNIYQVRGHGDIIAGRIEQGSVKAGMNVRFYPNNACGKVMSIEMHHKNVEIANAGDNVGLCIRGLTKNNGSLPKSGDIMGSNENEQAIQLLPLKPVSAFTAMVFVQDHPGKLKCNFTPLIHVRTSKVPCKMVQIDWKCGKSTGNLKIDDNIEYIEAGDQAQVKFMAMKPFVVQSFDVCKPLARMAAMDSNALVMMGKIVEVEYGD